MEEKKTTLKDGREVLLRLLRPDDKDSLLNMMNGLSPKALRWSNPPYDEVKIDRWMSGVGTGLSIVAIYKDRVVGISAVHRLTRPRERGIGNMMIYLHQNFHGAGLGTVMIEEILMLAKCRGLHRIGLEVVEDNDAAVTLYKKRGFEVEGVLHDAYFGDDGEYHDMLVMGIILPEK